VEVGKGGGEKVYARIATELPYSDEESRRETGERRRIRAQRRCHHREGKKVLMSKREKSGGRRRQGNQPHTGQKRVPLQEFCQLKGRDLRKPLPSKETERKYVSADTNNLKGKGEALVVGNLATRRCCGRR